jgi:hypothetical protein
LTSWVESLSEGQIYDMLRVKMQSIYFMEEVEVNAELG